MQVWILVTLGSTAGLFVLLVLWHWQLARVFMLQHLQRSMEKQHLQPHSCSRVNGPSTAILIATAKLSALITTTYWRLVLCLIGKETHLLGWGGEHQTNHECLPLVQAFFFILVVMHYRVTLKVPETGIYGHGRPSTSLNFSILLQVFSLDT